MATSPLSGNETAQTPGAVRLPAVLAWLREVKELIALVLFFAGGVTWLAGYFATKAQVEELRCLLLTNVGMVDSQMHSKIIGDELARMGRQLEDIGDKEKLGPLSDFDKEERKRLSLDSDIAKAQYVDAEKTFAQNADKLRTNFCQKGR